MAPDRSTGTPLVVEESRDRKAYTDPVWVDVPSVPPAR